jgi:hypothetical protein
MSSDRPLRLHYTCAITLELIVADREPVTELGDFGSEGAVATPWTTTRAELEDVANAFESKYGGHFTSPDGTWFGLGDQLRAGNVPVFRVEPVKAFAFGKGTTYSQTRYTFA